MDYLPEIPLALADCDDDTHSLKLFQKPHWLDPITLLWYTPIQPWCEEHFDISWLPKHLALKEIPG